VLDLIERGGIVKPQVNERDGRAMPDFRWPAERLILEADGKAWHDHKLAREDDVARQAELEAAGWRVLRVTWAQAIDAPAQTIARLKAAGAPPGATRPRTPRP
jgi:very-short-patch-repair endonuclease